MTSLLLKIFTCPIAVIVAMYLFPGVNYVSLWQPIIIGFVLAVIGVAMEYLILKKGNLWLSVVADFVASVLLVYLLSNLLWGSSVTFQGAVLIGLLLGVVEFFVHRYLITAGKTKKSPI